MRIFLFKGTGSLNGEIEFGVEVSDKELRALAGTFPGLSTGRF